MTHEKAVFEATCPGCGEKIRVEAGRKDVAGSQARVETTCQRCLGRFEAIAELDCLEWDDACKTEIGRLG